MEAFLTLSESDLREIGVTQQEPRRQILAAITELQTGKGREKQHYQDSMRHFSNTMKGGSSQGQYGFKCFGSNMCCVGCPL